jgi:hypothetical protein
MIIDFTSTYDLDNFTHCCICGKENDVFELNQYTCYDCKLLTEIDEMHRIKQIWVGWDCYINSATGFSWFEQPFFLSITKSYIKVFCHGEEIKNLPAPETIDMKKLYNNIDTYKLLI